MKISIADIRLDSSYRIRENLDQDTVERYMETFDRLPPITVFSVDGTLKIVDGEHRLTAAKRLDLAEIDADIKEGTDSEAREYAYLANLHHGRPLNRKEKQKVIEGMLRLHSERADNWIAEDVGCKSETVSTRREELESTFQIGKLDELIGKDGKPRPRGYQPRAPELTIEPNHLYPLDCIEGMSKLAASSVDLIFADPPYSIGQDYGYGSESGRPGTEYFGWCKQWFESIKRILKDGGSFYAMHYPEVAAKWKEILDGMLTFQGWIVWHYPTNIGHSQRNWTRAHRAILFYTKGEKYTFNPLADAQPYRNPTDKRIKALKTEGTTPYDVWETNLVKNVSKEKEHTPNQLPQVLLRRIILTSSNEGDLILDPFIGSGTTPAVAKQAKRKYIGFDINADYIRIARERLNETGC